MSRIFLLSPANCRGRRARHLLSGASTSDLATRLRGRGGAPLGEVFSFMSGLYFRGKLTYARRFAAVEQPADPQLGSGVLVITPGAGLRSPDTLVTAEAVCRFAAVDIDLANDAYRVPFESGARALAAALDAEAEVVLLGSIASPKYVDVLVDVFGDRLVFPLTFVGRGDMSRGGLLLRHVASGAELTYGPLAGATRRGPRAPKLPSLATTRRQ